MKKIINFLRKIGVLRISSGDNLTGEYDDLSDIKTTQGTVTGVEIKSKNSFYSHKEKEIKFSKEKTISKPKWLWILIGVLFVISILFGWAISDFTLYLILAFWVFFILILFRVALSVATTVFLAFSLLILSFVVVVFNTSDDIDENNIDKTKPASNKIRTITVEAESSVGIWNGKKYSHIAETNRGGEKAKEAYLGDGGATLKYGIYIEEAGKYDLFLRLSDDAVHSSGTRNATIEINGTKIYYKHKAENTNGWKWYKIGNVKLISGDNYINIVKDKSTPAAFIIDKFKFVKEI